MLALSSLVISVQDISLLDLERGDHTIPVNLPAACQMLYGNMAASKIVLNTPDFLDSSKAIQRSVTTLSMIDYQLKRKDTSLGGLIKRYLPSYHSWLKFGK